MKKSDTTAEWNTKIEPLFSFKKQQQQKKKPNSKQLSTTRARGSPGSSPAFSSADLVLQRGNLGGERRGGAGRAYRGSGAQVLWLPRRLRVKGG